MDKVYNYDNKLVRIMGKLADLIWLQILTILCCLPIITIGAAFTAMHKILLQLRRKEEGAITREYFRSFRSNLGQGILIWLLYVVVFLVLYLDKTLLSGSTEGSPFRILLVVLTVVSVLMIISLNWVFVILSRYHNTFWGTLRSAFLMGLSYPLHSIAMIILALSPLLTLLWSMRTLPVVALLGITLPGFLQAFIYSGIFEKMEKAPSEAEN